MTPTDDTTALDDLTRQSEKLIRGYASTEWVLHQLAVAAHEVGILTGTAKGAEMGETRGFVQGNREGFTTGYDEACEVWYRRGFLDGFTDRACYTEDAGEDRASRTGADWPPGPPRTDRGRSSHMLDKKTPHPHEGAY